jgi:hypothetical protein
MNRWAFFLRPAERDWIREAERIVGRTCRWHQPHICQNQANMNHQRDLRRSVIRLVGEKVKRPTQAKAACVGHPAQVARQ